MEAKMANVGEVEKNIPIPADGFDRKTTYPLRAMEIGDSFWTDTPKEKVHPAVSYFGKRNDRRFITRKMDGGIRVWRVA
jgi:hypothetical protein